MPGHPDPGSAARGSITERYARALAVSISPDGGTAVVLLGTNEPPQLYPYEVECHREADGWHEGNSSNGEGWKAVGEDGTGVLTAWGEDSRRSEGTITLAGERLKVPVVDGYDARKVSGTFLAQPPADGRLVHAEVVRDLAELVAV